MRVFILLPLTVILAISVPAMAQDASPSARELYTELASLKFDEGDCEGGADAATLADPSGVLKDERNLLFGMCLSNRNLERRSHQINRSNDGVSIEDDLDMALTVFERIDTNSPYNEITQVLREETESKKRTYDSGRCTFGGKETCFSRIKLEYDNMAFSGGEFRLDDEDCMEFKDEYDRLYTRRR